MLRFLGVLGGLGLLLLVGCDQINQPVTVKIPSIDNRLVVNSLFSPDSLWAVRVSKPSDPFDDPNATHAVQNATVEIWANGQLVVSLNHVSNGLYRATSAKPQYGMTYQLRVQAAGFPSVSASATLPKPLQNATFQPSIRRFTERDRDGNTNRRFTASLNLSFKDGTESPEHYMAVAYRYVTIQTPDGAKYRFTDNHRFNTTSVWLRKAGDYEDELSAEDDFRNAAVFLDEGMNAQTITIPATTSGYFTRYVNDTSGEIPLQYVESNVFFVMIASISKEFYEYERSLQQQDEFKDVPIIEPIPVYSNIQNGYGIFAGYSPRILKIE